MRGFESHRMQARVAQLVEHWSNKPTVAGSIPVVSNEKKIFLYVRALHLVGFEPTPPKRPELESGALDHSATDACNMHTTPVRFELTRAEPIRFLI